MARARLIQIACGIALGISTGVASAAFVDFVENPDEVTPVSVLTNLRSFTGGDPTITVAAESASVNGFHFPAISPNPVTVGVRSAGLFEPGSTLLSDLVIVEAQAITQCTEAVGLCQRLIVSFFSDVEGGPPLESLIPAGSFRGAIPEDGTLQDLSSLLGTLPEGLVVRVQSDLGVPEPVTLALLGIALAGLRCSRRRRVH